MVTENALFAALVPVDHMQSVATWLDHHQVDLATLGYKLLDEYHLVDLQIVKYNQMDDEIQFLTLEFVPFSLIFQQVKTLLDMLILISSQC